MLKISDDKNRINYAGLHYFCESKNRSRKAMTNYDCTKILI